MGVAARTSATRSATETSTSCPTAEITGTGQAARTRASRSSSKSASSSCEPPPRVTTTRSTRARQSALTAEITVAAAPSPCTRQGATSTGIDGNRPWSTRRKSRSAAPVGLVATPMRRGRNGQRPLARRVEQPLLLEPGLELLQLEGAGPGAAQLHLLHHQLVLPMRRVDLDEATGHHLEPLGQGQGQAARLGGPEHGAQHRLGVLEGEVDVAAPLAAQVGHLACHPDVAEARLQGVAQGAGQLPHREGARQRRGPLEQVAGPLRLRRRPARAHRRPLGRTTRAPGPPGAGESRRMVPAARPRRRGRARTSGRRSARGPRGRRAPGAPAGRRRTRR